MQPKTFTLLGQHLAICVSVAMIFFAGQAWADRVALVIGNGAYAEAEYLPNPPNDASAIGDKLEGIGFTVTKLVDGNLADMRAAIKNFGQEARKAEIAVIFYAGHGLQADGENYLVPVDAKISRKADLATDTLSASEIFSQLLVAEPEVALLIFDACRNNPFITTAGTAAGLSTGSFSASAFVQRPNSAGMIIGFAAAPGAVAFDGSDGNSPYTTALLQWIDRPGLELGTMLRRVRGTVLELTSGAQVPWVEEALLRDVYLQPAQTLDGTSTDNPEKLQLALLETIRSMEQPDEQTAALAFYGRLFGTQEAGTVTLAALAPDAIAPGDAEVASDDAMLREGLIWLSIRRSTDIAVFESFVAMFPESPFAALASEQIAKLTAQESAPPVLVSDVPQGSAAPSDTTSSPTIGVLPDDMSVNAPQVDPIALPVVASDVSADASPVIDTQVPPDPATIEAALNLDKDVLSTIQVLLTEVGTYSGPDDAIYGPATRAALSSFQTKAGLTSSGFLDADTLRALVQASAGPLLRQEPDAERRLSIHKVASIAQNGAGAEPVTLRVAALSRNDDVHAYWQELSRRFEAEHPGTLVEFIHQPDWSFKQNILGMLGSDTPPDLIHTWGGGHLEALREAGFVRDLTDEMAEGWALEFRPGALGNFTHDGAIYGAPTFVSLVSLWVNEPLLAEKGIPLEQLETWDGFMEAVRELKAQDIVPIAIGGRDAWPFQMIWGNIALQIGGREAFDAAYTGLDDGFRDPVFLEASERMLALGSLQPFQPDFETMDEGEAGNAFARGEAAMVVTGNWRLHSMGWNWPGGHAAMEQQLRRLDFPVFAAAESNAATYGGVDGYAVNSQSPAIAVELLRLLSSREVQVRTAELSTSVPSVSGADLVVSDPLTADVAKALLDTGYLQLYYDQALGPIAGEVVNDMAKQLGTGTIDSQTAVKNIADAWDMVLVDRGERPGSALQP